MVEIEAPGGSFGLLGGPARKEMALDVGQDLQKKTEFELDGNFGAVPLRARSVTGVARLSVVFDGSTELLVPRPPFVRRSTLQLALHGKRPTFVLRGEVDETPLVHLKNDERVVGVFNDPEISALQTCLGDPALDDADAETVSALLGVAALREAGCDGSGTEVAVVDNGIDVARMGRLGRSHAFGKGWTPPEAPMNGAKSRDHGTMCAFEIGLAAPSARLLDYSPIAGQQTLKRFLSDAVLCYLALLEHKATSDAPLIVTNSWGLFSLSEDAPSYSSTRYSDNPGHLFYDLMTDLEAAGVDIVFAAGNCGGSCADDRCGFGEGPKIVGAASHDSALCVGGVDTAKEVVGYSSWGPGSLEGQKPDVMAYTHFIGSAPASSVGKIAAVDEGTSAAAPVAAGVIAALRTQFPPSQVSPATLRNLCRTTALKPGVPGFDNEWGWGILNPPGLLESLRAAQEGA